jgi:hypothetical protein
LRLSYFNQTSPPPPLININDIRVASPCAIPWDAMDGNEHVRHCGECKLTVYNLSAMTEIEIHRLLTERAEQRVCVRFYRRADGTMLTQDCPRGLKRLAKRVSKLGVAVFSALVSMNYAMAMAKTTAGTAAARSKTQPQACPRVQAQEKSANILVVVTDPDGAVVPGARIALVDKSGKTRFSGKTNGAGSLMKNDLPAGDYTLKVAAHGFKEHSDALHLEHSKNMQVNLKLSLAATSTTVEVFASPVEVVGTFSTSVPVTAPPSSAGHSQPRPMRQ